MSSTQSVSSELSISQSSVIRHFHNLGKSIPSCKIVHQVKNIAKLLTYSSIIIIAVIILFSLGKILKIQYKVGLKYIEILTTVLPANN